MFFFLCLAAAGIFLLFLTTAFLLFRFFLGRRSSFFSYADKIQSLDKTEPETAPEEHSIRGGHHVLLKGRLYRATSLQHTANDTIAVLFPGYGDSIKTLYGPARFYLDSGCSVFIPYPRGTGESGGKYSGTPSLDAKDLISWLKYLSRQFPDSFFVLHGFSLGAATVILAATSSAFRKKHFPEKTLAIVSDSPFTSFSRVLHDYLSHFAGNNRFQKAYFLTAARFLSLICFLTGRGFCSRTSPKKALQSRRWQKASIPLMLIHGKADALFNPSMAEELFSVLKDNDHDRLLMMPDTPHGGAFTTSTAQYTGALSAFITIAGSPREIDADQIS